MTHVQHKLAAHLRVVVFLQESKSTDFHFPTLAPWGAEVLSGSGLLATPPTMISRMTDPHGCTTRWETTLRWLHRSTTMWSFLTALKRGAVLRNALTVI